MTTLTRRRFLRLAGSAGALALVASYPFFIERYIILVNRNYSSGLKFSPRGLPIFISKGIGWAYYPIRFNCLPEIAVLELRSQPA